MQRSSKISMLKKITGFHKDEFSDWVADLSCGHTQHTRHNPPWQNRIWVMNKLTRDKNIGVELNCLICDKDKNDI